VTKQIASLMTYWPIVMLGFAGVSSGFAFYHSMQNLQYDFTDLKQEIMVLQDTQIKKNTIELELKLRDTQISDLKDAFKSSVKQQDDINSDFEDDIKYLHQNNR